jgi:t-SNARE complex subunit (syntaxin)
MAKMTDEEFDKAIDEIVDSFMEAAKQMFYESNKRIQKLISGDMSKETLKELETKLKEYESQRKDLRTSMKQQIKNLKKRTE